MIYTRWNCSQEWSHLALCRDKRVSRVHLVMPQPDENTSAVCIYLFIHVFYFPHLLKAALRTAHCCLSNACGLILPCTHTHLIKFFKSKIENKKCTLPPLSVDSLLFPFLTLTFEVLVLSAAGCSQCSSFSCKLWSNLNSGWILHYANCFSLIRFVCMDWSDFLVRT